MTASDRPVRGVVASTLRVVGRVRRASADERLRPIVFALAAVLFIGLTVGAARSSDLRWSDARWWILGPAALLGPLATTALNGFEVTLQGRLVGVRVELPRALRISVLASAANLLPVPGAVLVRGGALMAGGATARDVTRSTIAVALNWLGASAVIASIGLALARRPGLGVLFAAAGIALVVASVVVVARAPKLVGSWRRAALVLTLAQTALVTLGGIRLFAAFAGFGIDVSIAQVAALTASNALAAAAGVFPAGLGLREGLLAVLGEAVGITAAASVIAGSFDRIASFLVTGVAAAVLGRSGPRRRDPSEPVHARAAEEPA